MGLTGKVGKLDASKAKILLYDVESSPNLAYCWGKYEQDVLEFISERQIISFAWKWLGQEKVNAFALPMCKTYKKDPENNKEVILRLHEVMSEADIVIGHNVRDFDDKMVNTDFLRHGLMPPPPHKVIDTLEVARSRFRLNSNKLDDLGVFLKCGKKVHTGGFRLWSRCLRGDKDSWDLMIRYNKNDVVLLEKIYMVLRPWMTNHPDVNIYDRFIGCPVCRGTDMEPRGWSIRLGGKKHRYQCRDCGKWASGSLVKNEWKFKGE